MSENRLSQETSPYLLQHAANPVHWYPWSEEALQRARAENKPILLSIGYSACHWCHVMAHESFEDAETAGLMNAYFINIKVDREERPDIDRIYQTAQHLLTRRSGGWPLTMFLTPDDHLPFFGGTYFPRESRHGLPGFKDLLRHIHNVYQEDPDAIRAQNRSFLQALEGLDPAPAATTALLDPEPLHTAISQFQQTFNRRSGGFGGAPKFPQPVNLEFLLSYAFSRLEGLPSREAAADMALYTLEHMARGGIYDHVGGGFARYAVDDDWMIPHFEKMLYDNGPLLGLYTQAWQITGNPLFRDTALETAGWVMREMQSADGGYYSSLDADSEGEEGKFYVWDREEIRALLPDAEFGIFADHYGLNGRANFEGRWHLYERQPLEETARQHAMAPDACEALLNSARDKLYAVRDARVHPGRDDKILTSWNALMIQGMALAAGVFAKDELLTSASAALDFVHERLWVDGRLLATCKDDRAHLNAYLDDHACLIEAILTLLQVRWNGAWLEFAIELAEVLLQHFADDKAGGFYFTAHDHEKLIQRNKPLMDETLPAGNGVAARVLLQLGHLLGEPRYLEAAEQTLKFAWHGLLQIPYAHGSLLCALLDTLEPPAQVILRGPDRELRQWQQAIDALGYDPQRHCYAIPDSERALPGPLAISTAPGTVTARLCHGNRCLAPISELQALLDNLKTVRAG